MAYRRGLAQRVMAAGRNREAPRRLRVCEIAAVAITALQDQGRRVSAPISSLTCSCTAAKSLLTLMLWMERRAGRSFRSQPATGSATATFTKKQAFPSGFSHLSHATSHLSGNMAVLRHRCGRAHWLHYLVTLLISIAQVSTRRTHYITHFHLIKVRRNTDIII